MSALLFLIYISSIKLKFFLYPYVLYHFHKERLQYFALNTNIIRVNVLNFMCIVCSLLNHIYPPSKAPKRKPSLKSATKPMCSGSFEKPSCIFFVSYCSAHVSTMSHILLVHHLYVLCMYIYIFRASLFSR